MIDFNYITFYYPKSDKPALEDIVGEAGPGIHLLLGENGAGKTTLLHVISGLLFPQTGYCAIDGVNTEERHPEVLAKTFFVGDDMLLPVSTIMQFAEIHGKFYPGFSMEMLQDNLSEFGLTGKENVNKLSLGNRRKAILSYALALNCEVLLLDEPANGLDITAKQALQRLLVKCVSENQTVIISTHTVGELATLFDGVIMMNHGRMLLSMPTWKIAERLTFSAGMLPPESPIYCEQRMGLFRYICAATPEAEPGDIDYTILFNALMSPQKNEVLNHLKASEK